MIKKRCEHYYGCDVCGEEVDSKDDLEMVVLGAGYNSAHRVRNAFKTNKKGHICKSCIKDGKTSEYIKRLANLLADEINKSRKSYYQKFKEIFWPFEKVQQDKMNL